MLRGIYRTVEDLPRMKVALDVNTVRDLALYPPYIAALIILNQIHPVLDDNEADDAEAPAELQPKVCLSGNPTGGSMCSTRGKRTFRSVNP